MAAVAKKNLPTRSQSDKLPKSKKLSMRLKKLLTPRSSSLNLVKTQDPESVLESNNIVDPVTKNIVFSSLKDGQDVDNHSESTFNNSDSEAEIIVETVPNENSDTINKSDKSNDDETKNESLLDGTAWGNLDIVRTISQGSKMGVDKLLNLTNLFEPGNITVSECDDKPDETKVEPGKLDIKDLTWLSHKNSPAASRSPTPPITITVDNSTEDTVISTNVANHTIPNIEMSRSGSGALSSRKNSPTVSITPSHLTLDVEQRKRNSELHCNFPTLPADEICLEDWYCALQKEILVSGRFYVTKERIFFHSNLFGWVNHTSIMFSDITRIEKKSTAFVIPNAIQIETLDQKYFFSSFISRDATFSFIYELWHDKCPTRATDLPQTSGKDKGKCQDTTDELNGGDSGVTTQCSCLKDKGHEGNINADEVYPTSLENLFKLLFGSDIDFVERHYSQSNDEVKIDEWKDDNLRKISYIKPLSNSIGPKQTRCDISETILHRDFDDYCTVEIRTQNPDVPSGDAFTVVSRMCFMRSRSTQCRMVTSTTIEWSKSSWIKGPIESGAKDGTNKAAQDFDKAIRGHLESNPELVTEPVGAAKSENSGVQELVAKKNDLASFKQNKYVISILNNRIYIGSFILVLSLLWLVRWSRLPFKIRPDNSQSASSIVPVDPTVDPNPPRHIDRGMPNLYNPGFDNGSLKSQQLTHLHALQSTLKTFQDQLQALESAISEIDP